MKLGYQAIFVELQENMIKQSLLLVLLAELRTGERDTFLTIQMYFLSVCYASVLLSP